MGAYQGILNGGEATSSGFLNLENVSGTNNKVNLTSVTSQDLIGTGISFTAGNNIQCGQPVFYNYSSTGVVTAVSVGTLPLQHDYIGIALNTVTTGQTVNVLTKGLVTKYNVLNFSRNCNFKQYIEQYYKELD